MTRYLGKFKKLCMLQLEFYTKHWKVGTRTINASMMLMLWQREKCHKLHDWRRVQKLDRDGNDSCHILIAWVSNADSNSAIELCAVEGVEK